jgi:uncharacterized membrane protein YhiD involved in acid resistance
MPQPVDYPIKADARARGGNIYFRGLSTGQGLAIASVAGAALGAAVTAIVMQHFGQVSNKQAQDDTRTYFEQTQEALRSYVEQSHADMRSRYEQSYRELATKVALNTNATDDMRASLIARGINPNNHDVTDPGGNKP